MDRTDATGLEQREASSWRSRLAVAGAALLVFGISLAIRNLTNDRQVSASDLPDQAATATPGGRSTAASASAAAPTSTVIPDTVAVVNQQRITRGQLAQECLERYGDEVLESLVNKHLILQECQRQSIVISPQDIEQEIAETAKRFNLSADIWLKMLQEERQINPTRYRQDIVWPMLALRRLAADEIAVSPEQLQAAFESEYGPKVQVRMIATSDPNKAARLLQQVQANPEEFGNLAKEHSEDANSASARGLIPPIRRHLGEVEVEQAVFALQPGEISPIVSIHGQHLIFRCERHLPASHVSPQMRKQVEDRLRSQLVEENLRASASTLFERLQQDAEIVNVFNSPELRAKQPGVAAMVNGKPVSLQYLANECLARYGSDVLEAEIRYALLSQFLKQANLQVTQEEIRTEIARAAEAYGYFDPKTEQVDVDGWLKAVTEEEGVQVKHYVKDAVWPSAALKKLVSADIEVTQEDFQKGFEANYGPRVEILAVVCSNQRVAQEVWDLARKNPTRAYFSQLATQYSVEPVSRANMGEVPPIQRYSGQPALEKEAFALEPGKVSGIVAVGDTFVVMYCLGHTEPVVTDPNDVRDVLMKELYEKKLRLAMSDRFEQIKAQSRIDNYLAGTSQEPHRTTDRSVKPASAPGSRSIARPIPVVTERQ